MDSPEAIRVKVSPEYAFWNVLYHTSLRNYESFSLKVTSILSILLGLISVHLFPMTYFFRFKGGAHRVHAKWHRPLSDLHSIMMNKLAQAGEGEGCTPPPFNAYKVARVRSSWEGRFTPAISSLSLCRLWRGLFWRLWHQSYLVPLMSINPLPCGRLEPHLFDQTWKI